MLRILQLAARVGALEGFEPVAAPMEVEDGIAFAREPPVAGTVLVQRTDGGAAVGRRRSRRVAVIGHNADFARSQGGGSATVLPEQVVSPLEGIPPRCPKRAVWYAVGAVVQEGIAEFPLVSSRIL